MNTVVVLLCAMVTDIVVLVLLYFTIGEIKRPVRVQDSSPDSALPITLKHFVHTVATNANDHARGSAIALPIHLYR